MLTLTSTAKGRARPFDSAMDGDARRLGQVDIGDKHRRAGVGETASYALAEARAAAGDDRHLAVETHSASAAIVENGL